jgi:hypothetical protein
MMTVIVSLFITIMKRVMSNRIFIRPSGAMTIQMELPVASGQMTTGSMKNGANGDMIPVGAITECGDEKWDIVQKWF